MAHGLALGCAMKQIDDAPSHILGIGFKRGISKEREQVGPDCLDGLADSLIGREVGLGDRWWANW